MTNKFNSANLQKIAKSYALKITDEYFKDHTSIDGAEIIKLTETKQLNLFIIKTLFEKWRADMDNLKSPYFNFEAAEVVQSQQEFMNILSRNILVKKENFVELLSKATEDTLQIFIEPKIYFEKEFNKLPQMKLKPEWIQENGKFFACYASALRDLSGKMFGEEVYVSDAVAILSESISTTGLEIHDEDIRTIFLLAGEKLEDKPAIVPTAANTYKKDPNQSFFDSIEAYKHDKVEPVYQAVTPVEPIKVIEQPQIVRKVEEIPVPSMRMQAQMGVETTERRIENLQEENITVNDVHQKSAAESSNSHSFNRIENIKSSISLNQKYLFINNLFDGDGDLFDKVLIELENAPNLTAAKDNVLGVYQSRYRWNMSSPEVEEFFDILKRKYN